METAMGWTSGWSLLLVALAAFGCAVVVKSELGRMDDPNHADRVEIQTRLEFQRDALTPCGMQTPRSTVLARS